MGLFNFIKGQFIEVIEWTDNSTDTIVYQFPVQNKEIKMGAQLTVRESQAAIFVNEGKIADVFGPGRYTLSTENMPVMTKLRSWKYGFNSPFKAEVYFVNTKQFTDLKWGTSNPIMMRDVEFGMLRLRAFGIYSFRVAEPVVFMKEIFGTSRYFDTESIEGQLKHAIISGITDVLAESKIAALDLAMNYDELGKKAKEKLQSDFNVIGLQLSTFYIENISLPDEVEKVLDKRTSMGVIGDMHEYAKYQTAEAIRDAANNPSGGFAGLGAGIGAAGAIGNMMGQAFNQPKEKEEIIICPSCGAKNPASSKFCSECGKTLAQPKVKCIKCGTEIDPGVKFCPECGAPQIHETICKKCGAHMPSDSKFCPECGAKNE